WISVEDPTEQELLTLSEKLNLEPDILLDALDPFEVPRIEKEEGITYIFARFAHKNGDKIITSPVLMVVSADFLITVSVKALPFIGQFIQEKVEFYTIQRTKLLILLLMEMQKDYQRLVNAINKNIRNISLDLDQIDNKEILTIIKFETLFNDFLFGLEPMAIALRKFATGKFIKLYEEDEDLVEELLVDNEQLILLCKANRKGIYNLRESHYSVLSNNLNKTIKLLTSVTVILTVPTLISGYYGMNVALPLQDHPIAFLLIIAASIILSFGLLAIFSKRDLL
ncbi:magnesium transporter CorA family protein, partial [Candidatus Woesebacteria bacterium]|nr:magnesium transporter CorA family protein [Candidatus Woesebacteria bacterium]